MFAVSLNFNRYAIILYRGSDLDALHLRGGVHLETYVKPRYSVVSVIVRLLRNSIETSDVFKTSDV